MSEERCVRWDSDYHPQLSKCPQSKEPCALREGPLSRPEASRKHPDSTQYGGHMESLVLGLELGLY